MTFGNFRYQSNSLLFTALNRPIYYPRTGARTGRALSFANRRLFTRSRRVRARKVLVVITDGGSIDDVHGISKRLRANGITIYSVGVGRYFNAKELDSMATDPDKTHVFTSDFKQIQYITNDLKKAICLSKYSTSLSTKRTHRARKNWSESKSQLSRYFLHICSQTYIF